MLRIEPRRGHRRIRGGLFVSGDIPRSYFEPAFATIAPISQSIDGKAQVWQDLVVDDVVEKNGIRVEGILRQDDTIVKSAVLADRYVPGFQEALL